MPSFKSTDFHLHGKNEGTIILKAYSSEDGHYVETGETVDVRSLVYGHSISLENLAVLLDGFCNGRGSIPTGRKIGTMLHQSHRAIQDSALKFFLGLILGLAEQERWDARNAYMLGFAKWLHEAYETNEFWDSWERLPAEQYGPEWEAWKAKHRPEEVKS